MQRVRKIARAVGLAVLVLYVLPHLARLLIYALSLNPEFAKSTWGAMKLLGVLILIALLIDHIVQS